MNAIERFWLRKQQEVGVSLNEVQKQAVLCTEGPLLLLASPGSGKTTTLMMRIGYLIEELGALPSRIKAVTFSRASAQDMKERFARLFPAQAGARVGFSTIHSFAFEVVREHYRRTGTAYRLIEGDVAQEEDEEEQGQTREGGTPNPDVPVLHKKFILRHLYRTLMGDPITEDQMEALLTYISYVKNKMIPPSGWAEVKCDVRDADRILQAYERFKRSGTDQLLVDFDDMLTICNDALGAEPELLRRYQRRYDYVLADESQDTSLVQFAILEKLVRSHGNLCVVADDDQSIYSWRGAEPQYLLDFKRTYPGADVLLMEQNYRSTREIVDAANRFIKRNKHRYPKEMRTDNPGGEAIEKRCLADFKEQAKHLARRVAALPDPSEAAILYRNHASSIVILNEFDRAGIPFYMKDGDHRFFAHWVVEDVLNFMRMAYTDKRPDLLERIHAKLNGYITKDQMAALRRIDNQASVFDNLLAHVPLREYQVKLIRETKETFGRMKALPPRQAIRTIRWQLGYERALEKLCERFGFRLETLVGILNTLEDIADSLETMADFASRLKYLEEIMKASRYRSKREGAVTFSTFHSAKGLEFDHVYMIDLIEGVIPSQEDIKKYEKDEPADMEEAVRLFYVGMTRARRRLELLAYKRKDGAIVQESRFMTAVRSMDPATDGRPLTKRGAAAPSRPKATPQLAESIREGSFVKHRAFGEGEVLEVDEERIRIRFASGEKRLSAQACAEMGLLEPV
ncbi:ATP-dependent helicase [Cohnella nanjingensis]|uniref:DNA 3'-5' helicase n=1 Tax=Cohnella nanjingensis TaxID=1387779 RepID=A0A7X0RS84_9BACL|nr:ATP-dependent helicase [Cohnella nanjingensis]MBB6671536.1 ATP-dependent helicase [Cohnella nanjingensis]